MRSQNGTTRSGHFGRLPCTLCLIFWAQKWGHRGDQGRCRGGPISVTQYRPRSKCCRTRIVGSKSDISWGDMGTPESVHKMSPAALGSGAILGDRSGPFPAPPLVPTMTPLLCPKNQTKCAWQSADMGKSLCYLLTAPSLPR